MFLTTKGQDEKITRCLASRRLHEKASHIQPSLPHDVHSCSSFCKDGHPALELKSTSSERLLHFHLFPATGKQGKRATDVEVTHSVRVQGPQQRVSGPKYQYYYSIWALLPRYLGPWILRDLEIPKALQQMKARNRAQSS